MIAHLDALSAQQNKHLLNVEFSHREHWPWPFRRSICSSPFTVQLWIWSEICL